MEVKFGVEPLYLGQNIFWKKNVFWAIGVPELSKNHKWKYKNNNLWFFDAPGTPIAQKTGFFQKNFALNKVAQLQILLPHPTTFLTSRASFRKKWMIFGLRSNFPCAAKFNGRLLFWKIFRGNGSKIAGSKLQLVLFDAFLYNKLIPENTFLIFPQNWPKQHLPTCPPVHLPNPRPQLVPTNLRITQPFSIKIFLCWKWFRKTPHLGGGAACWGNISCGVSSLWIWGFKMK